MGYTKYWSRPKELPVKKFKAFANDCKKLFEYVEDQLDLELANNMGDIGSEPMAGSSLVAFNGSETQPVGAWTTKEQISIPWPSATAGLSEPKTGADDSKTNGFWFAGNILEQRVAPTQIVDLSEYLEKLYDRAKDETLTQREKEFLKKYFDAKSIEFGSGSYDAVYIPRLREKQSWEEERNGLLGDFCKTAYRPYDIVVTAVLISLLHHFPVCTIGSDGFQKDWQDGAILCNNILGYGLDFSLGKESGE